MNDDLEDLNFSIKLDGAAEGQKNTDGGNFLQKTDLTNVIDT